MSDFGFGRNSFDSRKRSQIGSSALQSFFTSQPNSGNSNNNSGMGSNTPVNTSNTNGKLNSDQMGNPARKSQDKPFMSLYERTLTLISKLYSVPDFEYYLFPGGIASLFNGDASPVIDPISILWNCFRLGAPFCHLLNQMRPKTILNVPDVSGLSSYTNLCKKAVYQFLVGVKEEIKVTDADLFSISELYKDDTNGLVKVLDVVQMVLDEISRRGLDPPQKQFPFALGQVTKNAQDNRSKAIAELLSTERSYIQSLQELLSFQQELEQKNTISKDIIHSIFSNLHELLDFQRRFLFSLEATLALPPQDQNIGAIFIQYEDGFQVYHPMCASYSKAIQLALDNQQLFAGGSIDPGRDLQGYLIKPVQRICRYPMLLKEIVKLSTPDTFEYYSELKDAELIMKKVADQVNEVQRMAENRGIKDQLLKKIVDLQSLNPNEWGDLLLYDTFPMVAKDVEQMYHIYLFELLVLCCKETPKRDSLRGRRSRDGKDGATFDIKGKIYATSISDVVDISNPTASKFGVKVFWNDMEESFTLKCRNAEQAELWAGRIYACATGNTKSFKKIRPQSENRAMEQQPFEANSRRLSNGDFRASLPGKPYKIGTDVNDRRNDYMNGNPSSASTAPGDLRSREPYLNNRRLSNSLRSPAYSLASPAPNSAAILPNAFFDLSMGPPSARPPNAPLPAPPQSGLPPPPLKSSLPIPPPYDAPPRSSLPNPPSFNKRNSSIDQGPPRSVLPQPPNFSNGMERPPKMDLPSPPVNAFQRPPKTELPLPPPQSLPGPPKSELPQPPSIPSSNIGQFSSNVKGSGSLSSVAAASPRPSISLVKMKTHYGTDIFVIAVPALGAKFEELLDKVERKIKICGAPLPVGRRIKLRYRDEDGDFITINSDDDVEMAFELARRTSEKGTVTIQAE